MKDDQELLARALRDLARREGPAPTPPPVPALVRRGRRARRLRTATRAAAGALLASAAAVVILGGTGIGPGVGPGVGTAGAPPSAGPAGTPASSEGARQALDARSVLLAAAESARHGPAAAGRYWHVRARTTEPVRQPQAKNPPFAARVTHTQDTWYAARPGAPSRTVTGQDPKVTFASPEDEARWRRLGSPDLSGGKPSSNDYAMQLHFLIGSHRYTLRQLLALPADEERLAGLLRRLFDEERSGDWWPGRPTFTSYVWTTAQDLLAGPISPGTRSSLYRLLAGQPAIRSLGEVTDPLGRTGVALTLTPPGSGEGAGESRLVVDVATARLLAYELRSPGRSEPLIRTTYEQTGWVDRLGARP
ncbi:CU044_5270 family protein [Nonomuraea sp. NPDC001636]|uniref:CU044_5270 family protein n=1 Tax=Nonomuraea sp. NPDC001636 TaxID=3154391 RepID=UPI00332DE584